MLICIRIQVGQIIWYIFISNLFGIFGIFGLHKKPEFVEMSLTLA